MRPVHGLAVVAAFGFAGSATADWHGNSSPADVAAIRALVGAFRTAIHNKDEAAFRALFIDGPVVWQSVDSDATRAAEGRPGRDPVERTPDKTPASFIRGIVRHPGRTDESMTNIRVASDGVIASVSFDFVYSQDGRPLNWGLESWQLLNTAAGWRIVSVVWSNHRPAAAGQAG